MKKGLVRIVKEPTWRSIAFLQMLDYDHDAITWLWQHLQHMDRSYMGFGLGYQLPPSLRCGDVSKKVSLHASATVDQTVLHMLAEICAQPLYECQWKSLCLLEDLKLQFCHGNLMSYPMQNKELPQHLF